MRGLASTRGFPNCAVSLSVIDRFASAINTGHQALATPYRHPLPIVHPRPPTYTPYNLFPSIPLTAEPTSIPFVVVLSVSGSFTISFSLFSSATPASAVLCLSSSATEGRKTLTFKRASEGEHGALSTPSRYSPPWPFPLSPPAPVPSAARHNTVFSTAAFKLRRWRTDSLSLYSAAREITSLFPPSIRRVSDSCAPTFRLLSYRI